MWIDRSDNSLQFVAIRDILGSCLTNGKGGYNAYYGAVSYTRGGSRKAEVASRYRETVTASRQDTGRQDRGVMAHQYIRIERISGSATQETSRTTRLVLPVAPRISSKVVEAVNDIPCEMLPVRILS